MRRWRTYRVLVVLVGLSAGASLVEFAGTTEAIEYANAHAAQTLMKRYPDSPRHLYVRGLWAVHEGKDRLARRLFEGAIDRHYYANEGLLHNYVRVLIRLDAPRHEVRRALDLWRTHYPHSRNPSPLAWHRSVPKGS